MFVNYLKLFYTIALSYDCHSERRSVEFQIMIVFERVSNNNIALYKRYKLSTLVLCNVTVRKFSCRRV